MTVLIAEVGQIFIALDEIGAAFDVEGFDVLKKQDLFFSFCESPLELNTDTQCLVFVAGSGIFLKLCGLSFRSSPLARFDT